MMIQQKIRKILIANRGEIACRIARTARELGIQSVAVFSDADAHARHVAACDEAVHIGAPPARDSYLVPEKILAAARQTGANAIHPGYGFLSENADFADTVMAAGLIWIGPPSSAIRAMGGKAQAKALMATAGVPLVPGYHGDDQSDATLLTEAVKMGFPILIKASAGGGGKGMKIVEHADDMPEALASARREALAGFGDDRVLLEKYLRQPRHVEVQVFCDQHGNGVYLYERDCSIQRRHQKVVEEAPAPGLDAATRARLGQAALAAARSVDYVGAGTVEFLLDRDGAFYFMEMNTRLQVEHPVTEAITGFDLVAWQCRIAEGHPLPVNQSEVPMHGHAIEVRLYAEDPDRGFLPQTGHIDHVTFPDHLARIDTGIRSGDEISIYYDPMIAKIITHGPDREAARQAMMAALAATKWVGPICNLDFLRRVLAHDDFAAARLDTGFIERLTDDLLPPALMPDGFLAAAVALYQASIHKVNGPWARDGWWLNGQRRDLVTLLDDTHQTWPVSLIWQPVLQAVGADHAPVILIERDGDHLTLEQAGHRRILSIQKTGAAFMVRDPARPVPGCRWTLADPIHGNDDSTASHHQIIAPMPGKITKIAVSSGDQVTKGALLLVLEAMKMEHSLTAPGDAVIDEVRFQMGDQVRDGDVLVTFQKES